MNRYYINIKWLPDMAENLPTQRAAKGGDRPNGHPLGAYPPTQQITPKTSVLKMVNYLPVGPKRVNIYNPPG